MGDLVNLNKARKQKQRADRQALASSNRVLFGVSKFERKDTKLKKLQEKQHLDGHRRETAAEEDRR